jgi:nicotinamidase-related amidase
VEDLLKIFLKKTPNCEKVYLLDDCMSPVVIPALVDFTDQAEAAFQRFAQAGMKRVRSTELMENWA